MNGLRVYINRSGNGPLPKSDGVFYSRRGEGPFYHWLFEEQAGKWRASRVVAADFSHHSLSTAAWKSVPADLQAKMSEHYLD